jgi:hypothetical protein
VPAEGQAAAGDRVVTLADHASRISQLRKSSRTPSHSAFDATNLSNAVIGVSLRAGGAVAARNFKAAG